MSETWRLVLGGDYEVSYLGNVRRATAVRGTRAEKMLTRFMATTGYYVVNVRVGRRGRVMHVHALVAEAFIGPRPDGVQVNHIDGVKTNNAPSNLEYVTRAENMAHAARLGLVASGDRHYRRQRRVA